MALAQKRRVGKKQVSTAVDTRENLLRLAARSFSTSGYTATTMRGIAEQAGIEAASIYYHFASKEALVDEVMEHGAEAILQHQQDHLDALGPGADAKARFKAALLGQASALLKYGDYAMAHGRLLAQLPEKVLDRQIKRRDQHQKLWGSFLENLRSEGMLRADVDVALCRICVLGFVNSVQTWFNPRKGSLEQVVDDFCTIFFEGAGPSPHATRASNPELMAD